VIAVDTNILVYAHREDSPFHEAAFGCLAELAEGPAIWAIP
jgi:predicted nucleic acid-binding protein